MVHKSISIHGRYARLLPRVNQRTKEYGSMEERKLLAVRFSHAARTHWICVRVCDPLQVQAYFYSRYSSCICCVLRLDLNAEVSLVFVTFQCLFSKRQQRLMASVWGTLLLSIVVQVIEVGPFCHIFPLELFDVSCYPPLAQQYMIYRLQ